MPRDSRYPRRRIGTLVALALLLTPQSLSCSNKSITFDLGGKPLQVWMLVLDNDRYLVYKTTIYPPANPHESLPPPECNWQAIETLRPFAHDNFWLSGLGYVLPVESNEPHIDSVSRLLREESKMSWTIGVPLSALPPSDEVQAFRNHLEALSP